MLNDAPLKATMLSRNERISKTILLINLLIKYIYTTQHKAEETEAYKAQTKNK